LWDVGAARRELKMDFLGLELLGWAQPKGRIRRIETPLQVRAVMLQGDGHRLVYACAELCFITQSVRDGVFASLAEAGLVLEERELVIAATHTHSGPAGFSHDVFYNLSNPGHCPDTYRCIVDGLAEVVLAAWRSLEPGRVWLHRGEIPQHEPVAFNRSLKAFQRNVDAPDIDVNRPETATNRDLTVLRVDGDSGPRAAICWFAVHNTNVHFDQGAVHGDNKGIAAALMEDYGRTELGQDEFVGIFAQGAPGDVTPNFRASERGFQIGHHDDDFESAAFNGQIQMRYARDLHQGFGEELHDLDTATVYADFNELAVNPKFTGGLSGRTTGPARYGIGLIEGTGDGPGPLWNARIIRRALTRTVGLTKRGLRFVPGFRRRFAHGVNDVYGPMYPFIEAGKGIAGRAFHLVPMSTKGVPRRVDPVIHEVKRLKALGADLDSPWTPSVHPIHIARIGGFVLASLPCEPTTTAGWRISSMLTDILGADTVQVAGYSNGYHGYLTTFEEYQIQAYEGAHTVFGQWTLAAYQTVLYDLAHSMKTSPEQRLESSGPMPTRYDDDELGRRLYVKPPPTRNWG
jgi:neutral ceramidase